MTYKPLSWVRVGVLIACLVPCGFAQEQKKTKECEVEKIQFNPPQATEPCHTTPDAYYAACKKAAKSLRDRCDKACKNFEKLGVEKAPKCDGVFKPEPIVEWSLDGDKAPTSCVVKGECICDP